MSALSRRFSVVVVTIALSVSLVGVPPALAQEGQVEMVRAFGQPGSSFSSQPASTLTELRDLFVKYRSDLETVLKEAGWPGDPQDLFAVVAGTSDQGSVEEALGPYNQYFEWMAFRKEGHPTVLRSAQWSPKQPKTFDAWKIVVESNHQRTTFLAPKVCLNLAQISIVELPPEAACTLDTILDCQSAQLAISATGIYDSISIDRILRDGSPAGMDALSGGGSSWSYALSANGRYEVAATARAGDGSSATCSDTVTVDCPAGSCTLQATLVDPRAGVTELRADGTWDSFDLSTRYPDGSAGTAPVSTGDNVYRFDPADSRRPGGVYEFTGRASNAFGSETCTASVELPPPPYRWTVRAYGSQWSMNTQRSVEVADQGLERRSFRADAGEGYGLDLEYRATDRLGVVFSLVQADFDAHFNFDDPNNWLMDQDDMDLFAFSVGANFHVFDPGRRVDLFLGPLAGYANFDSVSFDLDNGGIVESVAGTVPRTVKKSFDDQAFFGARAGIDVGIGSDPYGPWIVHGGVRYLMLQLEEDGGPIEFDLDPFVFDLGLGYRF